MNDILNELENLQWTLNDGLNIPAEIKDPILTFLAIGLGWYSHEVYYKHFAPIEVDEDELAPSPR